MLRRGALTAFVDRHTIAWEAVMAALAVVYLAVGITADEGRSTSVVIVIVSLLAVVFLSEFFARLWDAPSRRAYVRAHWLDFVSSIPLAGGLRSLRILRLLRLGAALRLLVVIDHAVDRRGAARESFWFVGPFLIIVILGAALADWSFEHGVNRNINSFGDAIYWAFTTVSTVGYGDVAPVTPEGRVVAGLLIFTGIGLVGFISAQLTSRWLRSEDDSIVIRTKLTALETDLAYVRQLLMNLQPGEQPHTSLVQAGPSDGATEEVAREQHT